MNDRGKDLSNSEYLTFETVLHSENGAPPVVVFNTHPLAVASGGFTDVAVIPPYTFSEDGISISLRGIPSGITRFISMAREIMPPDNIKVVNEDDVETKTWMSRDAFNGKNILIFDDINDSGATFNRIKHDWRQNWMAADLKWQQNMVWSNSDTVIVSNVKTACLVENEPSSFKCNYSGTTINKIDDPNWIIFPWEEWWNPECN